MRHTVTTGRSRTRHTAHNKAAKTTHGSKVNEDGSTKKRGERGPRIEARRDFAGELGWRRCAGGGRQEAEARVWTPWPDGRQRSTGQQGAPEFGFSWPGLDTGG